jgi:hypothetical protein
MSISIPQQGAGRRHGQGEDTLSAEQEPAAQRSAASAHRMLRGWITYFNYGCSHATFSYLTSYLWKQVVRWQERKHRRTAWKQLRRRYGGRPADGGVERFDPARVRAKRYCCCCYLFCRATKPSSSHCDQCLSKKFGLNTTIPKRD